MDNTTTFSNFTAPLCHHLKGSIGFCLESCLLLMVASASTAVHYIFLKVLFKTSGHLPLNIKILLIHCTIGGLFKSMLQLSKSLYNFALLTFGFSALVISRSTCVVVELPYGLCVMAMVFSMVFIGIERLWTTWTFKNLNTTERVGPVVAWAQVAIWLVSLLIYVVIMTLDDDNVPQYMCYCYYSMLFSPVASNVNKAFVVSLQTVIVFIHISVMWQNKRNLFEFTINAARHSLGDRFVMWANVKTSRMLLPSAIVHAITYDLIIFALFMLRETFKSGVSDGYVTAMVATQCAICIDTMIQPVCCLLISNELKGVLVKMYPWVGKVFFERRNVVGSVVVVRTDTCDAHVVTTGDNPNLLNCLRQKPAMMQYHINPQQHQDMLQDLWQREAKKINLVPKSIPKK